MPTKWTWFKIWTRAQPAGTAWSNGETKEDNNKCSTQLHVALSHGTAQDGPEVEHKLTADKASSKTSLLALKIFRKTKMSPNFLWNHFTSPTYLDIINVRVVFFMLCPLKWFAGLQPRIVTTFIVSHSPEIIVLSGNWTHRSWVWTW